MSWTVAFGNSELRITGSGTYTISGEFALVHRLERTWQSVTILSSTSTAD